MKYSPVYFIKNIDLRLVILGLSLGLFVAMGLFIFFNKNFSTSTKLTEPETDDPFQLAQYYFNQDDDPDGAYDLVKARQYYEEVINKDPDGNQWAWYQLGRIDFLEGNFNNAIYKFNKQIQYFGDNVPNVYYMLGLTYGYMGRYYENDQYWQAAEENFQKFLTFREDSPWAKVDLSWVYFSSGQYEKMVPILTSGLEDHPDNPWLLNMYGLALLNTGKRGEANNFFLKAKDEAEKLTAEDWGNSYPGNNPANWQHGLNEFRAIIEKNLELTTQ